MPEEPAAKDPTPPESAPAGDATKATKLPVMTEPERQRIGEAFMERQVAAVKAAGLDLRIAQVNQQLAVLNQQKTQALVEFNNASLEQQRAQVATARHHGLDPDQPWNFNIQTGEITPLVVPKPPPQ